MVRHSRHISLGYRPGGNQNILRKAAVQIDPQRLVASTEMGVAADAGVTDAAAEIGGHTDPLAQLIALYALPHLLDHTADLMADHPGMVLVNARGSVEVHSHIGPAQGRRLHPQQNLARAGVGRGNLLLPQITYSI